MTADAAHRLAALPADRRALAEALLAQAAQAPSSPAPGRAPLSTGQHQMWLTDQVTGTAGRLIDQFAVRVRGPLDAAALSRAVAATVERHGILRTVVEMADGVPWQRVDDSMGADWAIVDVPDLDVDGCRQLASRDGHTPFDLARGPLARGRLYRMAPHDALLAFTLHHIATDAGSEEILLRDLFAAYRQDLAGGGPVLTPPAPQYTDFAIRQAARREQRQDRLDAYWRERLSGAAQFCRLPMDQPRGPLRQDEFFDSAAPDGLAATVASVAKARQTTVSVVLTACFRVLLAQVTGQRDTLLGTPMTGRVQADTHNMLGYFASMLVLRGTIAPDDTGASLIAAEHSSTMGAYAHQEQPFDRLVGQVCTYREPWVAPLVQVLFSYEAVQTVVADPGDLCVEPVSLWGDGGVYDLTVKVVGDADGFVARWSYEESIMEAATAHGLADRYWEVVAAVLGDLDASLPAVDEPDTLPVVIAWAGSGADEPPTGFVQEAIAGIWCALLDIPTPGRNEAFFELGGHSLTVARLGFALNETFGVTVVTADLFVHQTIAAQAVYVEDLLLAVADDWSAEELDELLG